MKRPLLLLLNLIPILLFAQQPVIFPDDFKTSALNGKEVTITNTLTLTNNYSYTYGTLTFPTASYGLLPKSSNRV